MFTSETIVFIFGILLVSVFIIIHQEKKRKKFLVDLLQCLDEASRESRDCIHFSYKGMEGRIIFDSLFATSDRFEISPFSMFTIPAFKVSILTYVKHRRLKVTRNKFGNTLTSSGIRRVKDIPDVIGEKYRLFCSDDAWAEDIIEAGLNDVFIDLPLKEIYLELMTDGELRLTMEPYAYVEKDPKVLIDCILKTVDAVSTGDK